MAAADARAARCAARGGARERPRALSARRARPVRLSGASTVQASLAALTRRHLSRAKARHVVVDSLFREWVARKTFCRDRRPDSVPLLVHCSRLGLGRPDLRAWAMYDWANSAFQTTIIAAIFPIYFHSVVAAGLAAGGRDAASPGRRPLRSSSSPVARCSAPSPTIAAMKKKMLASSWRSASSRRRRCTGSARRLDVRAGAVRHRQRRGRRQHRLLRVAAAASGRRDELDRVSSAGLRDRISRRRRAAGESTC